MVDARRHRLYCVREDHSGAGEAVNALVAVDLRSGESEVLVSGNDFYAFPRLSPDRERLAWTTRNHPNMPWDGCELWVGEIAGDGTISRAELVAGALEELECGILAHGFARARCEQCGQDFLVAYSCKGRGMCPGCNTRRMVERAAHSGA